MKKVLAVMMAVLLMLSTGAMAATAESAYLDKIDIRIRETAKNDEKQTVYIWYEDISSEQIEAEIESITGINADRITSGIATLSDDVASAIERGEIDNSDFREYMKETADKRETEQRIVNRYISTSRRLYSEAYTQAANDVITRAGIERDDIIFCSRYSPLMIVNMPYARIRIATHCEQVKAVEFYDNTEGVEPVEILTSEYSNATGLSDLKQQLGLDGTGVNVGIVEKYTIYDQNSSDFPASRFTVLGEQVTSHSYYDANGELQTETNSHVNGTARVFAGENGIANASSVYSAAKTTATSFASQAAYIAAIELLLDAGVSIINSSYGHSLHYYSDSGSYDSFQAQNRYVTLEKWIDHIANNHKVTMVISGGNHKDGDTITFHNGTSKTIVKHRLINPALAYNVITVNGCQTGLNTNPADDSMYDYSFRDFDGCHKPDITPPADIGNHGTSRSAPFLSGIIALMMQIHPTLQVQPEAVKAIVSASCNHKAQRFNPADPNDPQEYMYQGLTERQGAGVLNPYRAICITAQNHYGVRTLGQSKTQIDIRFKQPAYGADGLNVSVSWIKKNTISGDHTNTGNVTNNDIANLDLSLLTGSTTLATSSLTNSSTEMVYYENLTAQEDYKIRLDRISATGSSVKIGYAWSISTDHLQALSKDADDFCEGLYYLRNKSSSKYMTLNANGSITFQSFTGNANQQWVFNLRNTNNLYSINNASNDTGDIGIGTLNTGVQYNVKLNTTDSDMTYFLRNTDGSISIYRFENYDIHVLTLLNEGTSSGTPLVWKIVDSYDTTSVQRWYPENVAYQKGDVDMDGSILASDARLALRYSAHLEDLNNGQVFLADYDGNHQVLASDARAIERRSAGLE